MNKEEANKLFKDIQSGRGTGDLRENFLESFGAGSMAKRVWHEPEFTLGVEYGILIALDKVFNLKAELP